MNALRHSDFDIVYDNSPHYIPLVMADTLPMPMVTTLHTPLFRLLEGALQICPPKSGDFVAISESMR